MKEILIISLIYAAVCVAFIVLNFLMELFEWDDLFTEWQDLFKGFLYILVIFVFAVGIAYAIHTTADHLFPNPPTP